MTVYDPTELTDCIFRFNNCSSQITIDGVACGIATGTQLYAFCLIETNNPRIRLSNIAIGWGGTDWATNTWLVRDDVNTNHVAGNTVPAQTNDQLLDFIYTGFGGESYRATQNGYYFYGEGPVAWGVNDSGGTGKKALVVPN